MTDASTDNKLSIKANIVWNSIGNFVYLFCQWLLTYIVVKLLGFTDAGIFSLAMTISGVFTVIANYGMRSFQVSDINEEFSYRTYLDSRIVTCVLALVLCVLFELANDYAPYTFACIAVYMIFKVSEALSDVYQGMLQRHMRLDYVGKSFLIKGVLTLAVFTLSLIVFQSLLLSICLITIASFAVVFIYDRKKAELFDKSPVNNKTVARWPRIKSLLFACLPLVLYGFFFNITGQAPRYFIEMLLGEEALGFYSSVAMPVVIIQISGSFIFSPLVTPLAESLNRDDRKTFMSLIKKVLLFILALAIVSFVCGIAFGNPILIWAFGNQIAPHTDLLLPLILCGILTCLAWFLSSVLTVIRHLKSLIASSVISMIIVVAGCIPSIHAWGMNGANYVLACALAVFCVYCSIVIWKTLRSPRAEAK